MNVPDKLEEVIPRLRGVMHAYAFWFAAVAGRAAHRPRAGASARASPRRSTARGCARCSPPAALYHRWRWTRAGSRCCGGSTTSTIYFFIAATTRRSRCSCCSARSQRSCSSRVWAGAGSAIVFALAWIDAPRALVRGTYLAVGWAAVVAVPQLLGERRRRAVRALRRRRASSTRSGRRSTPPSARTRGRRRSASTSSSTRS